MVNTSSAISELKHLLGAQSVLDKTQDLVLYEFDGSIEKSAPDCVVFPTSTEDVVRIVKIAQKYSLPLVGRGAGTGLSGGTIPVDGGVMIAFARMNKILEIDLENEYAVVQPGVVNLDITTTVQSNGYYYAPDPSSQKACTIGGNVSENAGGPHTLAYGVTTNHVLGIEAVLPDGSVITVGGPETEHPGYDLRGLLTGSEGTMVLVTKVTVRLMRSPEAVKTLLAIYDEPEDAAATIESMTNQAIVPAAVEMLDGVMLRMIEEATHAGFPIDANAVLLIEVEGPIESVQEQVEKIQKACRESNSREVRVARSEKERELLWKGRKNAFGAVGRISPTYYVQDGVVPRTRIADTLRFIHETSKKYGIQISNIFHAGDGNMHPILLFDERDTDQLKRTKQAGTEILQYCIEAGGAITGEHGVGMEKNDLMPMLFTEDSLEMMERLIKVFNSDRRLNPGKILPTGKGCLEIRPTPTQYNRTDW